MKLKTIGDCQNYCEGVLNDFEAGIITKSDALVSLWEYTVQIHNLFTSNFEGRFNEKVRQIEAENKKSFDVKFQERLKEIEQAKKAENSFVCWAEEYTQSKCHIICYECSTHKANQK